MDVSAHSNASEAPYYLIFPTVLLIGKNRDSLKRHTTTCEIALRNGHPVSEMYPTTKGKKRKACDRCFRLKKACCSGSPCVSCKSRNQPCSYNRSNPWGETRTDIKPCQPNSPASSIHELGGGVSYAPEEGLTPDAVMYSGSMESEDLLPCGMAFPDNWLDPVNISFPDWDDIAPPPTMLEPSLAGMSIPQDCPKPRPKLDYLTKVTSSPGLAKSFECGTDDQRDILNAQFAHCDSAPRHRSVAESVMTRQDLSLSSGLHPSGDHNLDPLHRTSLAIVNMLRNVSSTRYVGCIVDISWSSVFEDTCLQFFAPHHLRRFLHLFWALWYPNCPIIHRPSFGVEPISGMLFTTMVLIGACLSPHRTENEFAKLLLNCVEEGVFADKTVAQGSLPGGLDSKKQPGVDQTRLQGLQAMYLVCVLQNWDGAEEAKRRIRRHRYPAVITVSLSILPSLFSLAFANYGKAARSLQIHRATHRNLDLADGSQAWWHDFAAKEELIR